MARFPFDVRRTNLSHRFQAGTMRAAVQGVVDVNNLADVIFVLVAEAGTHPI